METVQRALSEDEIRRVRELRKRDPAKAAKLLRRLKNRRAKKTKEGAVSPEGEETKRRDQVSVGSPDDADNVCSHQYVPSEEASGLMAEVEAPGDYDVPSTSGSSQLNDVYVDVAVDLDAAFTELAVEGLASAEALAELREVYQRFSILDETRAAGKGGAGEELMVFTEGGRAPGPEERRKKEEDEDEEEDLDQEDKPLGLSKKKLKQVRHFSTESVCHHRCLDLYTSGGYRGLGHHGSRSGNSDFSQSSP